MTKWLKPALLFGIVGVLHFVLSVAGVVLALPAAFDAQAGFWNAPVKITLVWIAAILLLPLELFSPKDLGYLEIGAISLLFGLAAAAITYAVGRARRAGRRPAG
jgi:hypothetical protein